MSQFEQLMTYLRVVETGSFTAAGDQLEISANAVSKQITQLEEQLGVTLLERSTRQLIITAIGQMVYEKGKAAQNSLAEINDYAHFSQTEPNGTLVIACPKGTGQSFMALHLAEFLQRYPQLTVKLLLLDKMPPFRSDSAPEIDIAFGFSMLSVREEDLNDDIVRRKVYEVQRILCAAPAYLSKFGEPDRYEDLKDHCFIAHCVDERNRLLKECQKRSITPARIMYVNDSSAILKCVLKGVGIANLPDFFVKEEFASGQLKRVLPAYQEPKIPCYLFYKKIRYIPPKVTRFIEFITEKLNQPQRNFQPPNLP